VARAARCEDLQDPELIIRVVNFELVLPIRSGYINVTLTDVQTDGQKDKQLRIAIYRALKFELRTSRGKNVAFFVRLAVKYVTFGISAKISWQP